MRIKKYIVVVKNAYTKNIKSFNGSFDAESDKDINYQNLHDSIIC